jgi:hypothetical protein
VKKHGTAGIFRKSFLFGDIQGRVEEILNSVRLSLSESVIQKLGRRRMSIIRVYSAKLKPKTKEYLTQKQGEVLPRLRQEIQVKVLSKYKTPLDKI